MKGNIKSVVSKQIGNILLILVVGVIASIFFDTSGIEKVLEMHKKFNSIRVNDVAQIKNRVDIYKKQHGFYPKSNSYGELTKLIDFNVDDPMYHYSYESNGDYAILTYVEQTGNGVKCMSEIFPDGLEISLDIKKRNCDVSIQRRLPNK